MQNGTAASEDSGHFSQSQTYAAAFIFFSIY